MIDRLAQFLIVTIFAVNIGACLGCIIRGEHVFIELMVGALSALGLYVNLEKKR